MPAGAPRRALPAWAALHYKSVGDTADENPLPMDGKGILHAALLCREADGVRGNTVSVYGKDDVTDRLRFADVRDI